jgi:agmatine deiminase
LRKKYLLLTIKIFYVKIINNTFYDIFCSWRKPNNDLFCGGGKMKADFNIHNGTLLLFPCRTDVWRDGAIPIARSVMALADLIAKHEPVYLGIPSDKMGEIAPTLPEGVTALSMDYDDIWSRDSGAVPVGEHLVKFGFNAWGGEDGLYGDWSADATLPQQMSRILDKPLTDCPLTLEGGNLATDGCGTVVAIKDTIVCGNRNPGLDEKEAERMLKNALNAHRVVWIEQGIAYDETGGHIDNLCAFADEKTVLLASGIISERAQDVIDCFEANGYRIVEKLVDNGWCGLAVMKK